MPACLLMAAAILIAGFSLTRVAFGHNAIGHFVYGMGSGGGTRCRRSCDIPAAVSIFA